MLNFTHLHVHNEYSLLDGFGTAKAYVKRAKEIGYKYLALTNHGNVDGCIDFQKQCLKNGINSSILMGQTRFSFIHGSIKIVLPSIENI